MSLEPDFQQAHQSFPRVTRKACFRQDVRQLIMCWPISHIDTWILSDSFICGINIYAMNAWGMTQCWISTFDTDLYSGNNLVQRPKNTFTI